MEIIFLLDRRVVSISSDKVLASAFKVQKGHLSHAGSPGVEKSLEASDVFEKANSFCVR